MRSAAVKRLGVLTVAFPIPGFLSLVCVSDQHQTVEITSQTAVQVRPHPTPTGHQRESKCRPLETQAASLTSEQAAPPCSFLFTFGAFSFALKPLSHLPAWLLTSASSLSPEPGASWNAGPVGVSSRHTGALRALGGRFLGPLEGRGHRGPPGRPENQPAGI